MTALRETQIPNEYGTKKDNIIRLFPDDRESLETSTTVTNNYKSTATMSMEDLQLISKLIEKAMIGQTIISGNNSTPSTYNDENDVQAISEEIREGVHMFKKAVKGFMAFGALGLVAFTVFATMGISGNISPFISLLGSLLFGFMTIGVFIDFKKWEKSHA